MYKALDVARYIVMYADKKEHAVSNIKLNDLLYFVQSYFMIEKGEPCFREPIRAISTGARVNEVWHALTPLSATSYLFWHGIIQNGGDLFGRHFTPFDESAIDEADKAKIRKVTDMFEEYSLSDMNVLIMGQTPWKDAYAKGYGTPIEPEALQRYFQEPEKQKRSYFSELSLGEM